KFFCPQAAMSSSASASSSSSPVHLRRDPETLYYDPGYTADISMKMRVPKSIRVGSGGKFEGSGGIYDEDISQLRRFKENLEEVNETRKARLSMVVPERILVVGGEQHIGAKGPPRELQLEQAVLPPDPGTIRVHTPPRVLTVEELLEAERANQQAQAQREAEENLAPLQNGGNDHRRSRGGEATAAPFHHETHHPPLPNGPLQGDATSSFTGDAASNDAALLRHQVRKQQDSLKTSGPLKMVSKEVKKDAPVLWRGRKLWEVKRNSAFVPVLRRSQSTVGFGIMTVDLIPLLGERSHPGVSDVGPYWEGLTLIVCSVHPVHCLFSRYPVSVNEDMKFVYVKDREEPKNNAVTGPLPPLSQ
ncbi:unnamed protein product, partial [Cyprideis torosa]